MDKQKHVRKFDKQAKKYKRVQTRDPVARFRKRIVPDAQGRTLEVAIGSGLNIPYYRQVTELIGIDFSSEMLQATRSIAPHYSFPISLKQADVETMDFEANSFDTIVSSLSFCSYEHPVEVLNHFARWCKPDGKILMMEHGKSTNLPLALVQKVIDPVAYQMIGCHQDRDILSFVKASQLEIIHVDRALAGFLYFIWAKPKSRQ